MTELKIKKLELSLVEKELQICYWQEETFKAKLETIKSNKSLHNLNVGNLKDIIRKLEEEEKDATAESASEEVRNE